MQAQLKLILTIMLFTCTSIAIAAQENEQKSEQKSEQNEVKTKTAAESKNEKTLAPPAPVSIELQYKEDLKHYFRASNVKPILAGPDDYLTLINENTSINNKGVAILLPDWQQGAVSPKAINFLRKALPKQGWTTISIQPANKPSNFPSSALKISEQQQANKKIIDEYKVKLKALINTVLTKSKDYPGIVIIVAQGNHGAMLVDIFDQQSTNKADVTPSALILLSSYLLNGSELIDGTNTAFAKTLAYSEYPVLDLYLKYDHPIVLDKAAQRLALAKQELKVYYRQRQINNRATGYYPEQELLIQMTSWLKAIGW